jgi:isopentenyldiphosphate isomerase
VPQHYSSPDHTFVDNELTDVFLLCKDIDLLDIVIDPVEVTDARYVSIGKLRKDVATANPELAPHQLEYGLLFPIVVKKRIKGVN